MKLIVATNRLCLEYRRRWEQHLKLASPEELETLKTWKAFEDWTLTLLDKTHVFDEADLMEMYTHARHNPSQDPHQFHTYLCAIEAELEKQFEPRSQKEQCLTFLVKLDPDLRCEIRQDLATGKLKLPENMSDMVRLKSSDGDQASEGLCQRIRFFSWKPSWEGSFFEKPSRSWEQQQQATERIDAIELEGAILHSLSTCRSSSADLLREIRDAV
ncbi:uncharacterized protein N7479_006614 [Penicillium vulpinum]|uniref:uncharacterized protein n=1 Tax=Penicillium vulpinum TaxID=29845 RepID=UPI0025482107|nr:uncharacterized protein N7479_006614 [Penicillium vulpinum]KAJ5959464.1 hypothetical protein N7479_006614 [Penicillium vulpinum]